MLSADVLIINSKIVINAYMINALKMCCLSYDAIYKYYFPPEIIYTNGWNDMLYKEDFIGYINEMK